MSLSWSTHTDASTIADTIVDNPTNELAYWECAITEFMTEFGRRPVDGKEFSRVAIRAQAIKTDHNCGKKDTR